MTSAIEELSRTADFCGRIRLLPNDEDLTANLLADVASFVSAETACFRSLSLSSCGPKVDCVVSVCIPRSVDEAYLNRYHELDPGRALLQHPLDELIASPWTRRARWASVQVSAAERDRRRAEFLRYRREFLLPNGFFHHLGFCFRGPDGQALLFDFHRPAQAPPFGKLDQARAMMVGTYLCGSTSRAHHPRTKSEDAPDSGLSAREVDVADAVVKGLSNKEVAGQLNISVRTVENHMRSIFSKLGVRTRTRLAAKLQGDQP